MLWILRETSVKGLDPAQAGEELNDSCYVKYDLTDIHEFRLTQRLDMQQAAMLSQQR